MTEQPAGIGHNEPPDEAELLQAELEATTKDIAKRIDELVAGAGRVPDIKDEDTAAKVTTLMGQIQKASKDLEAMRREARQPLNQKLGHIKEFFDGLSFRLAKAKGYAQPKQTAWLKQKEEERRAKEAEARKKIEEAAAKGDHDAVAKTVDVAQALAEPIRQRDDYGQTTSLRKRWTFEENEGEFDKIPHAYLKLDSAKVRKAISAGVREIPGLTIFQVESAVTRTGADE